MRRGSGQLLGGWSSWPTQPDERVGLLRDRVTKQPRAWVCRDFRCELPTDDPIVVARQLRATPSH